MYDWVHFRRPRRVVAATIGRLAIASSAYVQAALGGLKTAEALYEGVPEILRKTPFSSNESPGPRENPSSLFGWRDGLTTHQHSEAQW